MMGTLYQSIEALAKEKGIDPQIIRDAIKDAMLVVARKHFHTEEDLVAEFDDTGAIQIFGVRQVVEEVSDPNKEISVADARQTGQMLKRPAIKHRQTAWFAHP